MATSTTHYGLVKQADSDYADNTGLNSNFDKIDTAIYDAKTRYLPGFTIPATATWTQLTADNVASLDPEYLEFDPDLAYPWYTDIAYSCAENDTIEPMFPIGTEGIGLYARVSANKLRIYADSNKNGTVYVVPKCKKG